MREVSGYKLFVREPIALAAMKVDDELEPSRIVALITPPGIAHTNQRLDEGVFPSLITCFERPVEQTGAAEERESGSKEDAQGQNEEGFQETGHGSSFTFVKVRRLSASSYLIQAVKTWTDG